MTEQADKAGGGFADLATDDWQTDSGIDQEIARLAGIRSQRVELLGTVGHRQNVLAIASSHGDHLAMLGERGGPREALVDQVSTLDTPGYGKTHQLENRWHEIQQRYLIVKDAWLAMEPGAGKLDDQRNPEEHIVE